MKPELEQYRVAQPSNIWDYALMRGMTGYDAMEFVRTWKWYPVADWGRNGYTLGSWPLVIVFVHRSIADISFDVIEYVEGDVVMYSCPTEEIRTQIIDEIAFWHWKFNDEEWVKDYETIDDLPAELRGPFSQARLYEEQVS